VNIEVECFLRTNEEEAVVLEEGVVVYQADEGICTQRHCCHNMSTVNEISSTDIVLIE
jgi:hypothetical protein